MHHRADVKLSFPCLLPGAALGILPAISGWFVCLFWVSICCFKNWELVILSRRSVGYASWTADPKPRKAWDGFYKWYPAGFTCTSEACQLLLLRAALTTAHPGASSFTRCREEWGERCSSPHPTFHLCLLLLLFQVWGKSSLKGNARVAWSLKKKKKYIFSNH